MASLVQRVALTPYGLAGGRQQHGSSSLERNTAAAPRRSLVVCAGKGGIDAGKVQGGLSKKRCDLCLGTGQ